MKDIQQKIGEMKSELENLRDEVKLKAHLGKAEILAEMEVVEKEWNALLAKSKPFTDEAEKTAENAGAALELAADELIDGFKRIRKLF